MSQSKLTSVCPVFQGKDLEHSLDFYTRVMGFESGWKGGEPPDIASASPRLAQRLWRRSPTGSTACATAASKTPTVISSRSARRSKEREQERDRLVRPLPGVRG